MRETENENKLKKKFEININELTGKSLEMVTLLWFRENRHCVEKFCYHYISNLNGQKPNEKREIKAHTIRSLGAVSVKVPDKIIDDLLIACNYKNGKYLGNSTIDFFCHHNIGVGNTTDYGFFCELKSQIDCLNNNQKEAIEKISLPVIILEFVNNSEENKGTFRIRDVYNSNLESIVNESYAKPYKKEEVYE